jgi:hypothetical protein
MAGISSLKSLQISQCLLNSLMAQILARVTASLISIRKFEFSGNCDLGNCNLKTGKEGYGV